MGFFDIFKKKKKMSDGLEKTRTDFFQNIVNTLTSSVIDDDLYNDLEEQLILADVGPSCAVRLVDELRDEVEINGLHTGQEALDALTPEMFLPQLQQEKQEGWVCYLHYTKDVPDATVSVHHKTGQVEHLFVTESARGRGIGQKMLDDRLGVITEYGLIRRKDGQPLPVFQPEQEIGQGLEMM